MIHWKKGQDRFSALVLFLFTVFLCTLIPRYANAKAGEHGAGVGIGHTLLMGDFGRDYDSGLGFNLNYSYEASEMFGLLTVVHYGIHNNIDGQNKLTMRGLSPNLKTNLAYFDKLIAYAFGGFGIYMVNEKVGRLEGSATTFGLNLGAGLNLALDEHFQFGTRLSFHNVFNKTDPSTVSTSAPTGINIGGTFVGMFLTGTYIF